LIIKYNHHKTHIIDLKFAHDLGLDDTCHNPQLV